MTERRIDPQTRSRVGDIQAAYTKVAKRLLILATAQVVILLAGFIAFGYLVDQNRERIQDNRERIRDIQASRLRNAVDSCDDANKRRAQTLARLNAFYAKAKRRSAPSTVVLRIDRNSNVLVVRTMVPRRDCEQLATGQVRVVVGAP